MGIQGLTGSITKEYTVWCALCERWHNEGFMANQKYAEARFRNLGWKKKIKIGWVCPDHTSQ